MLLFEHDNEYFHKRFKVKTYWIFLLLVSAKHGQIPQSLNSLTFEGPMGSDVCAQLAHSCTRFPCYLGMEIKTINAKTQWTTTKIVELGN